MMVDVRARRAERWFGALALLSVPAVIVLSFASLSLSALLMWLFATSVIGAGLWSQGWLGGARRIATIAWLADGRWQLCDMHHAAFAELRPESRLGTHWLWLRWNAESSTSPRRHSMLLVRGDIPAADLRRLLVRLRLDALARRNPPRISPRAPLGLPGA